MQKLKYQHNTLFFNIPDVLNSYWAGFLAADGNIYYNPKRNSCRLNCTLKDYDHLIKFKDILEASNPIHTYSKETIYGIHIYHHFNIDHAGQLANDLNINFNITPRKSLSLESPNLSDENLIRAFIRGYFDGDGYITNGKTGAQIGFCGTNQVVQWIRDQLIRFVGSKPGSIRFHRSIYTLRFSGNKNSRKIMEWLYVDTAQETRLTRKFNRYLEYFNVGELPNEFILS